MGICRCLEALWDPSYTRESADEKFYNNYDNYNYDKYDQNYHNNNKSYENWTRTKKITMIVFFTITIMMMRLIDFDQF